MIEFKISKLFVFCVILKSVVMGIPLPPLPSQWKATVCVFFIFEIESFENADDREHFTDRSQHCKSKLHDSS